MSLPPPWTTTQQKTMYHNKYGVILYEDDVIRPDGTPGIHAVLRIKKGVGMVPIDDQGNVYLTKEYHYAAGGYGIEIPAGGIEGGEEPLESAQRELLEELGIVASKWTPIGRMTQLTTYVNAEMWFFIAQDLQFQATHLEETETATLLKIPFTEALEMVMTGEINCAPTCAALLKTKVLLGI